MMEALLADAGYDTSHVDYVDPDWFTHASELREAIVESGNPGISREAEWAELQGFLREARASLKQQGLIS